MYKILLFTLLFIISLNVNAFTYENNSIIEEIDSTKYLVDDNKLLPKLQMDEINLDFPKVEIKEKAFEKRIRVCYTLSDNWKPENIEMTGKSNKNFFECAKSMSRRKNFDTSTNRHKSLCDNYIFMLKDIILDSVEQKAMNNSSIYSLDTVLHKARLISLLNRIIFPLKAAKKKIFSGEVILKFQLSPVRVAKNIQILKSTNKVFENCAIRYILGCTFDPYMGGDAYYQISVKYHVY